MNGTPRISRLFIGLCFAFAGGGVAWSLGWDGGSPAMKWLALPAAAGAFITTLLVWPRIVGENESILLCTGAGAAIGVISHPVSALLCVILMGIVGLFDPERIGVEQGTSILEMLYFAVMWVFYWCLCAMFGAAWITMGIGALMGLLLGVTHRLMRFVRTRRALKSFTSLEEKRQERRRLMHAEKPWESLLAITVALLIASLIAAFVATNVINRRHSEASVVIDKPAPAVLVDEPIGDEQ